MLHLHSSNYWFLTVQCMHKSPPPFFFFHVMCLYHGNYCLVTWSPFGVKKSCHHLKSKVNVFFTIMLFPVTIRKSWHSHDFGGLSPAFENLCVCRLPVGADACGAETNLPPTFFCAAWNIYCETKKEIQTATQQTETSNMSTLKKNRTCLTDSHLNT